MRVPDQVTVRALLRRVRDGLPGFRSGVAWKSWVAIVGYSGMGLLSLLFVATALWYVAFLGLLLPATVLLALDGWGLRQRLPGFRSQSIIRAGLSWAGLALGAFVAMGGLVATADADRIREAAALRASATPTTGPIVSASPTFASPSPTATGAPRLAATTPTPSLTLAATPSPSPTPSLTPTPTASPTPTPTASPTPLPPTAFLVDVPGYTRYDPLSGRITASAFYRGGSLPSRALDPGVTIRLASALRPNDTPEERLVGLMESWPREPGRVTLGQFTAVTGWSRDGSNYAMSFLHGTALLTIEVATLGGDRTALRQYAERFGTAFALEVARVPAP